MRDLFTVKLGVYRQWHYVYLIPTIQFCHFNSIHLPAHKSADASIVVYFLNVYLTLYINKNKAI